jgi:Spy/CpxP family protein refolding chaperone
MTRLPVVIASALLCASLAFAQDSNSTVSPSPSTPQSQRVNLGLTQQQKTQLHDLRSSMRDQIAIIRHDSSLNGAQKQQQIQQIRQATQTQVKSVFTPAQQQQLAQMKAARQAKLGLTQAQKAQLKTLFSGARQQRQAVLNNASLSNQDKQAQLQQIRQNTKTQLSSVLTPDQLQTMRQMRHGRGLRG